MNERLVAPAAVAGWVRALAWIIVVASCVAAAGVVFGLIRGMPMPPVPWYLAAVFLVATIWALPLFWIVAFTGRAPRYWLGLGSHHWQSR
jgi:hypothetical protein